MINAVTLSIIITQTLIAVYLFNTLKLKDHFEKYLNAILVIFFFHVGTKLFLLVGLKNIFLYNNNASGFGLSYGPLLYAVTHNYIRKPLQRKIMVVHMLPFVACTLIYFISCAGYLSHILTPAFIISYSSAYQWVIVASMVIYPILCLQKIKQHTIAYATTVTVNPAAKLLRQLAFVMLGGIATGLLVALYFIIKTGYHVFDLRIVIYTFLAAMPVLILRYKMQVLASGTLVVKQSNAGNFAANAMAEVVNNAVIDTTPAVEIVNAAIQPETLRSAEAGIAGITEKRYIKSGVDDKMMDKYEVTVRQFMQKTKVYLDPEMSLEQLAAKANIPKHHITQLLNERFGKNFYAFINEYRIAEAMERLKTDGNLNILSLAYDCGFNSKSSFNTYFKKVTGLTPSAYKKQYSTHAGVEINEMA